MPILTRMGSKDGCPTWNFFPNAGTTVEISLPRQLAQHVRPDSAVYQRRTVHARFQNVREFSGIPGFSELPKSTEVFIVAVFSFLVSIRVMLYILYPFIG